MIQTTATKLRPVIVALALAGFAAVPARGQQTNVGDLYIDAHGGVDYFEHHGTFLYGARLGGYLSDHVAGETTVHYLLFNGETNHLYDASVGLLYDFNRVAIGWHPVISAGIGAEREKLFKGSGELFAFAGAGLEYHFARHWGVRADVRDINFFNREGATFSGEHNSIQATLGIVLHCACFPGSPSPVPSELPKALPAAPAAEVEAPAPAPPAPAAPVVAPVPAPEAISQVISFDRGARLTNIGKAFLDRIAARLKEDLNATAAVVGHGTTDRLARERAQNAADYLVEAHGIDRARITVTGETGPDAPATADVTVRFR